MIRGKLEKPVDVAKLSKRDFTLRGEFSVVDENYHGWRIKPGFREEGTAAHVPLDQVFSKERFHSCYELIVQTPEYSKVAGSGYLHLSQKGDASLGVRSGVVGQERIYVNETPIWFYLLTNGDRFVEGLVDLIFVNVSPWHAERDMQRKRVLCD